MADPNQPVAQILKTPINKQRPQKAKNIQCPSFFLSLKLNSETIGFLNNPLTTLSRNWPYVWCFLLIADSNPPLGSIPDPEAISDLGELSGRSISWWTLKVEEELLLLLSPPMWVLLLLPPEPPRLNDWARRVMGPEKRGLLTCWGTPSPPSWWWCPISSSSSIVAIFFWKSSLSLFVFNLLISQKSIIVFREIQFKWELRFERLEFLRFVN